MNVYRIDPTRDARWEALLQRHPSASVFHTANWLQALRLTYGYEPVVYTTSGPGVELENGVVFCHVKSWFTGSRMVSLPFSDHCQPLVDDPEALRVLMSTIQDDQRKQRWKYVELRPQISPVEFGGSTTDTYKISEQFYLHLLDLAPDLNALYGRFHKSCIQRKIHKGERENLDYEEGCSAELLSKFYRLLLMTRRRHRLPPQPLAWFQNLIRCLGERVTIAIASKDEQPVAAILTLVYKQTLVYKYGCSDAACHNLGGMPLLFWKAIQSAKSQGLVQFDFGRSEMDNEGLVTFKGHWGAQSSLLSYYKYPVQHEARSPRLDWGVRAARFGLARLPEPLLAASGRLLYKHVG